MKGVHHKVPHIQALECMFMYTQTIKAFLKLIIHFQCVLLLFDIINKIRV